MEEQKTRVKTGKNRLFIENIFAFLEKLSGKITPYFNLQATTIHNVLVSTLSNMIKCIRLKLDINKTKNFCLSFSNHSTPPLCVKYINKLSFRHPKGIVFEKQ